MQLAFHLGEGDVGERAGLSVDGMGAGVQGAPPVGESAGDDGAEFLRSGSQVTASVGVVKVREDAEVGGVSGRWRVGGKVKGNGFARVPV